MQSGRHRRPARAASVPASLGSTLPPSLARSQPRSSTSIPSTSSKKRCEEDGPLHSHLAIAAADEAVKMSELMKSPLKTPEMVASTSDPASADSTSSKREHTASSKADAQDSPLHPASIINLAADTFPCRWRQGPERSHRHRLHQQRPLHRRFLPHHPARRPAM